MADSARSQHERPALAVVLATRGRPEGASRAVRSLLQSARSTLVHVIDQGDDDATSRALGDFADDPRVSITRCHPRGLGAARNAGVRLVSAPIIAFTDDDCEVDPEWASALADAFASDSRIGMVFGAVRAASYDRATGFIPAYPLTQAFTGRSLRDKPRIEGIGACMAVRRSVWERLGGFDESFGAGAPFRAGEDADFAMRALVWGYWVHETPDAIVTHRGFRSWQQGPAILESYMFGLGAANAKLLRLGGWSAIGPLVALGWRWLAGQPVVDLNHRPPRLLRLHAFLRGAWKGLALPLDRSTGLFVPRA